MVLWPQGQDLRQTKYLDSREYPLPQKRAGRGSSSRLRKIQSDECDFTVTIQLRAGCVYSTTIREAVVRHGDFGTDL